MNDLPSRPNTILASLSSKEFDLLRPHLRTVSLDQKTVLATVGDRLPRVFFPHSGIIAVVVNLKKGRHVEVGMIGRGGMLGATAADNNGMSLSGAVVQLAGTASTLEIHRLWSAAGQSKILRAALRRQAQSLYLEAQQSAACNVSHPVVARLARWLLRASDVAGCYNLKLTQESLAEILGVQRNSVSLVAHALKDTGLIHYHRGHIQIIDRQGLMAHSCECYGALNDKFNGILASNGP